MIKKAFLFFTFAILFLLSFSSCKNNNKQTLLGNICDTSGTKYSTSVTSLMTSKCISCHNDVNPQGGISLEGYNNVNTHASNILSTLKSGSMPKGGSKVDDCTITKFEKWINDGKPNN